MGSLDYDALTQRSDAAYLLCHTSLRIARVNAAFDGFAAANGGPDDLSAEILGKPMLRFVPVPLRGFYDDLFRRVRAVGRALRHDYQCSSLQERRWFSQYIVPEDDGLGVYHVLASAEERDGPGPLDEWTTLVGEDGSATQCSHCRRVQDVQTGEWKLTRECYVRDRGAPPVREQLCLMCEGYYSADDRVVSAAAFLPKDDRFCPAAVTLLE